MRMKLFVIKLVFMILFFVQFDSTCGQETTNDVLHIVANGENIYKISHLYNVPPDSIRKWNHLDQNYMVTIGQRLVVDGLKSSVAETKRSPDNILAQIPGT